MAALALGVAGAAIGSMFGPIGTSVGWSIGAFAGGLLGRKSGPKPEVGDLRGQTSAYGTPIPIGYGTIRIAGFVMWCGDKVPHKNKSGGKGGPKPAATITYTQSYAIGLLETSFLRGDGTLVNNPIIGILRIWKDGQLMFGEGSPAEALPMTIYYGTEDQLPDPTIEADKGVGNVSAHRGMAYVVFNDTAHTLPCNWTFEVVASGDFGLNIKYVWPVDYNFPVDGSVYSYPYSLNGVERVGDTLVLHRYRNGNAYGPATGTGTDGTVYYDQSTYDIQGNLLSTETQVLIVPLANNGADVWGSLNSGIAFLAWQIDINCGSGFQTFSNYAWVKNGEITFTLSNLCENGNTDRYLPIFSAPIYFNGYVYASGAFITGDTDQYIRRWAAPDGAVRTELADIGFYFNADAVRTGYPGGTAHADPGDLIVGDDGYIYWLVGYYAGSGDGTRLFKFDIDLNLIQTWWSGDGAFLPTAGLGSVTIFRGHIIAYHSAGEILSGVPCFTMHKLNADGSTTLVDEIVAPNFYNDDSPPLSSKPTPIHYIGSGLAAFRGGILDLGSGPVTLRSMVENVSQHVGYEDDEIDATELTDLVKGGFVSTRMSGRAAIESWQPAYQFGAVERDFAVTFRKWTGEVDIVVPVEDLGAREVGSDPVDPLGHTRVEEKELPRVVECRFMNKDLDYQDGMQLDEGPTTRSDIHAAFSFALVLDDAEAKRMAEIIRVNALIERDRYKFSLPRKWTYIDPTTTISIGDRAIRLISKEEVGYTHILFEGLATRPNVFVTAPVASPPLGFVPQVPPTANSTELAMLDVPMDLDTDPQIGAKASINGRLAGPWPGASLFKSSDGGVNYESILATDDASTSGVAISVLGDWAGGNIVDESNYVEVRISQGSGELSSTNDLGLLNGANRALLGVEGRYEEFQYRDAELIDTKVYRLSGLLRGRRGSDGGIENFMGQHALDDEFYVLPLHNIELNYSELGQERQYKAVTAGGILASATVVPFTDNGVSLKCYAPVQIGGGRNGAGDITTEWVRRTRIGGAWVDNTDVPMVEFSEFYEITYADDNTFTTTSSYFSAVQSHVYPIADQTLDFGGALDPAYVRIEQLGSYGYGYTGEGVV